MQGTDGPAQAQDQAPVFSTPAWPDQSEWLKSLHLDGVSDSSPVTEYGSARRNSAASSNLATVPEGRGSGSGGSHLEIVAPSQGPSNRHAGNPYAALLRVAEEISAQKRARGHVKMTNQIRKCMQEWPQVSFLRRAGLQVEVANQFCRTPWRRSRRAERGRRRRRQRCNLSRRRSKPRHR